ncbi:MAG: crotonase/enoyl-CoA hydratase family protein, partial [Xanthomonadales bacterium]|nr:crotonase/enoyl-CoA hydratase family protein [Xanthomonadales bacterium]
RAVQKGCLDVRRPACLSVPEPFIQYELDGRVATIRIDDGKRNALSHGVLRELHHAFKRAEADHASVILTGREDVFSAGFDLNVMKRGNADTLNMLRLGYSLPARVLAHPYPVIAACNGHVFAMGVFLMLSADHVIGSRGGYRISANEVAIGLTMPRVAAAMLRHRLDPAAYQRAVTVSAAFDPESALDAGLFDELAEVEDLQVRAAERASEFQRLDEEAHRRSKRRIRAALIRRLRYSLPLDLVDAVATGFRRRRRAR